MRGSIKGSSTRFRSTVLPDVAMDSPFIPCGGNADCELINLENEHVKKNGSNKPPLPIKPSRKEKKTIELGEQYVW